VADIDGSGQQPAPGTDEIVVVKAPARTLCSSREHRRLGVLAEVVVTFGELGTAWQKDALWQTCWGRSYPLCGECWGCVRQVAEGCRLGGSSGGTGPGVARMPRGPGTGGTRDRAPQNEVAVGGERVDVATAQHRPEVT
jgi:hypothetical protein